MVSQKGAVRQKRLAENALLGYLNWVYYYEVSCIAKVKCYLMASYYTAFLQVIETEQFARESRHFGAIGPAILDLIEDDLVSLYVHPRAPDAFPLRGDDDTRGGKPADSLHFVTRRANWVITGLPGQRYM